MSKIFSLDSSVVSYLTFVHAKLQYIIKVTTFSIFVFKSEASSYLFE